MIHANNDEVTGPPATSAGPTPHWLTAERLRVYPKIFLAVYVLAGIYWVANSENLLDKGGKQFGYDFVTFWAASSLSLSGEPAAAFDIKRIFLAEKAAVPALDKVYLWHYPPTFELVITPLALLPYFIAYFFWTGITLLAFIAVTRRLAPSPFTTLLLLSSPGVFINAFHGQNGFLTAVLFAGALLLMERRPLMAGVLLGLLSFKPQFGILIPLALILGGRSRTFFAAAATTVLFAVASLLILGTEPWIAFLNNVPLLQQVFEDGLLPWAKMPSLFVALRMLGSPLAVAYAGHTVLALGVAATVWLIWWRRAPIPLAGAVLACGSLLATPYLFDYDLTLLVAPIALLANDAHRNGWLDGEREVLVLAWVAPFFAPAFAQHTQVQVGFLCVLALFIIVVRRAWLTLGTADNRVRL